MLYNFLRFRTVRIAFTILVMLLSISIMIYSLLLLIRGEKFLVYNEGIPPKFMGIEYIPNRNAIIPLISGVLIVIGTLGKISPISWLGLAILVIFSVVFIFGIGGLLLLPAVLIGVLITALQITNRKVTGSQ